MKKFINYTPQAWTLTLPTSNGKSMPLELFIVGGAVYNIVILTKEHVLGRFYDPNYGNPEMSLYLCRLRSTLRTFHYNVVSASCGVRDDISEYKLHDFYETTRRLLIRHYQTYETE